MYTIGVVLYPRMGTSNPILSVPQQHPCLYSVNTHWVMGPLACMVHNFPIRVKFMTLGSPTSGAGTTLPLNVLHAMIGQLTEAVVCLQINTVANSHVVKFFNTYPIYRKYVCWKCMLFLERYHGEVHIHLGQRILSRYEHGQLVWKCMFVDSWQSRCRL